MVKPAKSHDHDEEFDDEDDEDDVARNSSCSRIARGDGKSRDQRTMAHRSKHSETEQRRRSKINERFQILRDILPRNDQKRDKASFLLEVIEYIQFLQDKLNMYEGQYRGWSSEPKKLIPWRNNRGPAESFADHSQVIKNGFGFENNTVPPALLTNAQNSPESELGTTAVYKALDNPTGSATPLAPSNVQMKLNMFDPVVRGGVPTQALQESVSDAENMSSQPQSQWWHARPYPTECDVQNSTLNEQELAVDGGSVSISNSYSEEILNSLTQALQSSGVDLSQTCISVQINAGKPANSRLNGVASNSKDDETQSLNDQVMGHAVVGNCRNESGLAHKRLRTEES
ncbi:transcription factor BIM2-like [Juglans microcarpa x Juglans regia]|uniref:transcription factor BIM2-like n=1 Tax=Juglans microcarpa x Juglans regia TaxID=2249226 RepID=UPI001B7F51DD|nr:transcription factor BIM2-like [Juglans microcarpa x Juglans regia]XP_041002526.1 transcription factor BIM2-like [Juglans microcarpa x Juglans regia]